MIWCWRFCGKTNEFFPNGLYVSYLIEYEYIFFKIGPNDILISAGDYDMYPVVFYCEFLT